MIEVDWMEEWLRPVGVEGEAETVTQSLLLP